MEALTRNILYLLIILFIPCISFSQRMTNFEMGIDNLYSGEAVGTYDIRSRQPDGLVYLYNDTLKAAVLLNNGKVLNGVLARYNLDRKSLEVYTEEKDGEIPGDLISEFTLEDFYGARHRLVAVSGIPGNKILEGYSFVEIIEDGEPALLAGSELEVLPANYVPALDSGRLTDEYIVKPHYFIFDGKVVQEIPTKRKAAARVFDPYLEDALHYFQKQKPDLKNRKDLQELFRYIYEKNIAD